MKIKNILALMLCICLLTGRSSFAQSGKPAQSSIIRERISINENWSFFKYKSSAKADNLIYDVRPEVTDNNDNKVADSKPTEAIKVETTQEVLSVETQCIASLLKHHDRRRNHHNRR